MFASAKGKQQKQVRQLQCQEQRIDHIPHCLSGLSRSLFFPTTFLEVAVCGHGFYELSRMLMRKNLHNDVSKDSPTGQLVVATRKAIHYMQCEHSLRIRRFSRINLNVESFETDICIINCGQVKRRFSKKGYARTSHARPDFRITKQTDEKLKTIRVSIAQK